MMVELRSNIITGLAVVVVVRCPTVFGVGGPPKRVPSTVAASGETRGLVAYTNTEAFLVGPRGLSCYGGVGADGGEEVVAWAPRGVKPVARHSHGIALTLNIDPACSGCRADDACPFFAAFARQLGFPCSQGVPAGERVVRPRATLALFEDAPGVAGSGWPSGGPYPANGAVGIRGGPSVDAPVYRSTCTLPASEHAICTASLNDVIARYG